MARSPNERSDKTPVILTQFKKLDSSRMSLVWDDGHTGPVSLTLLRDSCPCAGCKGETVLFQEYVPPPADTTTPGRYKLVNASPVGSYALQLTWGDGHEQGIYTWEHLRSLCECDACSDKRPARKPRGDAHG
jgi:DUF971 family protein